MSTPTATTGSQVITDALRLLNVIDETQTPTAEQQAAGIRALNEMMAEWEADGCLLRYVPIGTATATLTVPDGAVRAIKYNLAIAMAPIYGASISTEVAEIARSGRETIDKLCAREPSMQLDIPAPADMTRPASIF